MRFITVTVCALIFASQAGAACIGVNSGDRINTPWTFDDLVRILKQPEPKGEYETTSEYDKRREAFVLPKDKTFIVSTQTLSEFIKYDADNERFLIQRYAWDNMVPGMAQSALGEKHKILFSRSDSRIHYVGLGQITEDTSQYLKRGVNTEAVKISDYVSQTYFIYDRQNPNEEPTFIEDFKEGDAELLPSGVYLPMKREIARESKEHIKFAVQYQPRFPYSEAEVKDADPRFSRSRIGKDVLNIFYGDIKCLLIMDQDNNVLKTVGVNY